MAQSELPSGPPRLSQAERAKVFDKACSKVAKLYFDPAFRGVDWLQHVAKNRESVISRADPVEFEAGVHEIFRALGTSHTGFFHESVRRVPYRLAIGVTCTRQPKSDSTSWVVRDVHERGPGAVAGLEPGDELIALDGEPIKSDSPPMLPMGTSVSLQVLRSGNPVDLNLAIPRPRSTKQPYSEPQSVVQKLLPGGVGYIKVSILPGLIGIDVANEIDSAFSAVSASNALILDLRGHLGGGLGVLRLMSHLTPHRLPIGYTLTRKAAEKGLTKDDLPMLDRLPKSKTWGILGLALRFGWRDPSVAIVSEGLGPKKCHGRIAILTNEGTVSAGEMVCAFARERGLATIVGTETAGRLIPGSGFKVGHGYVAIFPRAAYITWEGRTFEGQGIAPDHHVPWSFEEHRLGRDNQLDAALRILSES